jgi:hypothetical protein
MILSQYEYSIPASPLVLTGLKKSNSFSEQKSLIKIRIDFVEGKFRLDGDWQFMMTSNKNNESIWLSCHRERVTIATDIYPTLAINLEEPDIDGVLFSLQGSIADDNSISFCSGLLAIDNVHNGNDFVKDQWNISFYLYDSRFEDCEISFKLPVYVDKNKSYKN